VGKFTIEERSLVKSLVATLTLNRMLDNEIIDEIEKINLIWINDSKGGFNY
jgi:hypothetical protein